MQNLRDKQAVQKENTRAADARDNAKRFSALNSFIDTNSAVPIEPEVNTEYKGHPRGNPDLIKRRNENLAERNEEFQSLAEDEANRKKSNEDNYSRFLELKKLFPNQGLTSKYYPDHDYSSEDFYNQVKNKSNFNLSDKFDIYNPADSTVGFEDGFEEQESLGDDFTNSEIDVVNSNNLKNFTEQTDDSLILDDVNEREMLAQKIEDNKELQKFAGDSSRVPEVGFAPDAGIDLDPEVMDNYTPPVEQEESTREQSIRQGMSADELEDLIAQQEQFNATTPDSPIPEPAMTNLDQSLDGSNYDELLNTETGAIEGPAGGPAGANIDEEINNQNKNTNEAEALLVTEGGEDGQKAVRAVTDVKTDLDTGKITGEQAEFALTDIFGSLKDIFGVDNKSLLRAFVKYAGGRVFGLSSGKAAAFAWKGVEQDMAVNAAAGADAKSYASNMAEYDKQLEAALESENPEEAKRILSAMNKLSGVEKSDAEEFDDNISYLNKKYNEAEKVNDTRKMAQVEKQLKALEASGINGTAPSIEGTYDLEVRDANGRTRRIVARDGINGRETKDANGNYVPVSESVDPSGRVGAVVSNYKVNKADQPDSFSVDDRYENETQKLDDAYNDGNGTMSEEDYFAATQSLQDSNRNVDGEEYDKFIPGAKNVTNQGLVTFDPMTEGQAKLDGQLAAGVRGLSKVDAIFNDPRARERIGEFTSWFSTYGSFKQLTPSMWKSTIKAEISNPLQQMYYLGILEMTMARLRKDTGAAYNQQELFQTMELSPGYADTSTGVTLTKLAGLKSDLYAAAGILNSGEYRIGVLEGNYRPNDPDAAIMENVYAAINDEASYGTLPIKEELTDQQKLAQEERYSKYLTEQDAFNERRNN